ncbi:MAG: DUF3276 family protein [Bacteroidota bacterium]
MSEGKESRDDVYSKSVKAGKRTYFFDVKTTKGSDLYLTITESKKRYTDDGKFTYEKHKLFLYKEDFEKFVEGLNDTIARIDEMRATGIIPSESSYRNEESEYPEDLAPVNQGFTDVSFEDLGK